MGVLIDEAINEMTARRKQSITLIIVFFTLGGLARAGHLYADISWLRGIPQIMGALVLLAPIMVSLPQLLDRDFWKFSLRSAARAVVLLVVLGISAMLFASGILAYQS